MSQALTPLVSSRAAIFRLGRFSAACILVSYIACATAAAQTGAQSEAVQRTLAGADKARLDNEAKLKSALGNARLRQQIQEADADAPLTLLDASMSVSYDAPKFAIQISNDIRLREIRNGSSSRRWEGSSAEKVLVIFDGEALYLVQWDRRGGCEGEIYFAFSRQAVLRSAGFPFEHPIHIWREALNISTIKASRTEITPRLSGGFMAIERMASYDRKFFLFDRFGYDLRRVSTQRSDNGIPIREYSLRWQESPSGVFYLSEFSNTVTKTRASIISDEQEFVSKLTTKVTYDKFDVNIEVPANRFSINEYDIPAGTRFVDKRRRTQRNSATLQFDGTKLVPVHP
ncbi:MAG: hypothetical protein Aurels2KO_47360 [Aureliella sp.]